MLIRNKDMNDTNNLIVEKYLNMDFGSCDIEMFDERDDEEDRELLEEDKIVILSGNFHKRPKFLCDRGANRSFTNNIDTLHSVGQIQLHLIGRIKDGIISTHKGLYRLWIGKGNVLEVPMFYCNNASDTVISPTDIVNTYDHVFHGTIQDFDVHE